MKENKLTDLERENTVLKEQNAGLLKRVQELEALKKTERPSKSRIMAEETLKLLQAGPVA
jgi:cell shape-determining protein MreC